MDTTNLDQLYKIYESNNHYLDSTMIWSLVLIGIAALAIWFNQKRKVGLDQKNMQNLISMLLGFVILLSLCALIFSKLTSERIGPVRVFPDRIVTNEGVIQASRIKKAYLQESVPNTPFQLNALRDSSLLFIIEEVDGTSHVFTEDNYPIRQMMEDLRPWLLEATQKEKSGK